MPPVPPMHDAPHAGLTDPEYARDNALVLPIRAGCANRENVGRCELGATVLFTHRMKAQAHRMSVIFCRREPLQISLRVVRLVAVSMVGLVLGRWSRGEERCSDQRMHIAGALDVPSTEIDVKVASSAVLNRLQDAADVRTRPATHALHPPEIADLVPALIANDRTPFFGRVIGHRENASVTCGRASQAPRPLYATAEAA